jgi:hypothetical protein
MFLKFVAYLNCITWQLKDVPVCVSHFIKLRWTIISIKQNRCPLSKKESKLAPKKWFLLTSKNWHIITMCKFLSYFLEGAPCYIGHTKLWHGTGDHYGHEIPLWKQAIRGCLVPQPHFATPQRGSPQAATTILPATENAVPWRERLWRGGLCPQPSSPLVCSSCRFTGTCQG